MKSPQPAWLALLLPALVGCAGSTATAAAGRVVVLPFRAVGLGAAEMARVRTALSQDLSRLGVPLLEAGEVDQALARAPECREPAPEQTDVCAARLGSGLAATQVLSGAVGGLGRTFVVQLRLLEVRAAAVRSLEETIFGDLGVLTRSVGPIAARLFNVARPRPWYSRWWLWSLVGMAVSAAVVVPLAVSAGGERYVEVPLP